MSQAGINIAKRRKEIGMTQDQLAEKMGYKTRSTISRIESGANDVSAVNLAKFAEVLGTTEEELMGNETVKRETNTEAVALPRTYDDKMFRETFEREYTWLNGFMRNVRRFGSRTAIIDPQTERQWSYRQFNVEVNKLAHALGQDGVGKNDVVMEVLENCPEFCFTYVGPRKVGAITLLANYKLSYGELSLLIDHNKPKVIIYSAAVAEMVADAVNLCTNKPERCVMADNLNGTELPEGHITYEDYVSSQPITEPEKDFETHIYDEVVRMCTSGTSALPKSVPINDINEVLSAHDAIMHYPMSCKDICMNMTPLFHRGGSHSGGTCPNFYAGSTLVLMRAFQAKTTLHYVEKYGITFLTGSPATLEMLSRIQEKSHFDISSLKGIITMGAPLEKAACERFMEVLTPNIFNGYGTTETFWNSFLRPYDLPDAAGGVGGSCTDDEVRVVRVYEDRKAEPDEVVPQDGETVGEVIISSPGKTTYTYYGNEEEAGKKFYKGWMYTSDLGTWDDKTYVTITGRKDDMIVCSGENIYPVQIEEAINTFEKVADSMVTAVPDKVRGQAVAAYVVPADDSLTIGELVEFCRDNPLLSTYKRPRWYKLVDSLPHTATGKKMHYVLKAQAAEDMAAGLLKRK
ncbi:MAG: AMP-binding protein [Firmicutes bacterium]|nr:AMP-binding protein [Bacillota bacterium]